MFIYFIPNHIATQNTYHIFIGGIVQGVGFRPFVLQLARQFELKGWVNNDTDGVHIEISAPEARATQFYAALEHNAPVNALITHHAIYKTADTVFTDFRIMPSKKADEFPAVLISPDFSLCQQCREDLHDTADRRHQYAFTTCTVCGPRYSIVQALPYDREHTSMQPFQMCPDCEKEYTDPDNRRFHSQTNSCPSCGISMKMMAPDGTCFAEGEEKILAAIPLQLMAGKIIAVKSTGGYLLLCNATNAAAVKVLRKRKHRPAKPLALLFADEAQADNYAFISEPERTALISPVAPIVLLRIKDAADLALNDIAPGLSSIGAMLPSAPLLEIIARQFGKPLVATSANISNSPIIYRDEDALLYLKTIADYIVIHNREIQTPQDDSVMQFTLRGQQQIILRRSRGMAPAFIGYQPVGTDTLLATGAFMKSCFTIKSKCNTYISQYLGNTGTVEAQQSYVSAMNNLMQILHSKPDAVIADKHPGYFSSQFTQELAAANHCGMAAVQHHKAHFAAVLAENNLLHSEVPVLGVVWDGTGWGDDEQIWGGEFFVYNPASITRCCHFDYFPQLMNDKMAREPRLSALAACAGIKNAEGLLQEKFSTPEWILYNKMLQMDNRLQCSSMGRIFDAVASLLNVCDVQSFEGEAAMKLQSLAETYTSVNAYNIKEGYCSNSNACSCLSVTSLFNAMVNDLLLGRPPAFIAAKFHYSLVQVVGMIAEQRAIKKIAFSGGVFQNALLVDMMQQLLPGRLQLYFHRQLSPNDENISFGQMIYYDNNFDGIRNAAQENIPVENSEICI